MFHDRGLVNTGIFRSKGYGIKDSPFMVIDVVSTVSVDPEWCPESRKITAVTLNEIRGFGSHIFHGVRVEGEIPALDLGQPIFIVKRERIYNRQKHEKTFALVAHASAFLDRMIIMTK